MAGSRPTKVRDAPRTKANILEAAKRAFAEQSYAQTGIRDIAAMAGVSSTLLLRYYGSKAGLFEAALIAAMDANDLFDTDRSVFGAYLAAALSDPNADIKSPAMIAFASGDAEAQEIATRVSEDYGVAPLAQWLGPPDARARAAQINVLSIGYVMCTRQISLVGRSRAGDKKLAKWLAETVQAIVDQS